MRLVPVLRRGSGLYETWSPADDVTLVVFHSTYVFLFHCVFLIIFCSSCVFQFLGLKLVCGWVCAVTVEGCLDYLVMK